MITPVTSPRTYTDGVALYDQGYATGPSTSLVEWLGWMAAKWDGGAPFLPEGFVPYEEQSYRDASGYYECLEAEL